MLQSNKSLEGHKFFPFVAWTLVIGFALFVYTIVQDLRQTSRELSETASRLEARANTSPDQITDFSR